VKNCDRNVVSVLGLLSAALLASPACTEEQAASGPAQSGESSLGAAPGNPTGPGNATPVPPNQSTQPSSENRLDFPPDAGVGGPHLICDPDDHRYCKVSRPEDSVACAPRWEDVPARLNCGQLPGGSQWEIQMSPRCHKSSWYRRGHEEHCYYDARSGQLVASAGMDSCGIWCGGLRRVEWNEPPEECGNPMLVEWAMCANDGSTIRPEPTPPGGGDGGALDAPRVLQLRR
jgi:hypothetical protein